jgi:hypothetical protein
MSSYWIFNEAAAVDIPTPVTSKANVFLDVDGVIKYRNEFGILIPLAAPAVTTLISSATSGTIGDVDYVVLNPASTAVWALPTAVGRTRPLYILNQSSQQITLDANGVETINGDLTLVQLAGYPYTSNILIPIGGNWYEF